MQNIKLVVVGDSGSGKTSWMSRVTTKIFWQTENIPSCFDGYSHNLMSHGRPINMGIWDTAAGDDYDRLRPLAYPQTDVFMVFFPVISRSSFERVRTKWVPEVRKHWPQANILLLGTKQDFRDIVTDLLPVLVNLRGCLPFPDELVSLVLQLADFGSKYNKESPFYWTRILDTLVNVSASTEKQAALRTNLVSTQEGERMAESLGTAYMECSSLTGHNVEEVAHAVVGSCQRLHGKPKRKSRCNVS